MTGSEELIQPPLRNEASGVGRPDSTFDDGGNWTAFIRDSRDEAELAVYFKLEHKHDLRQFALSWPVIKTWIRAPHTQAMSLKARIKDLLQDDKEDFSCVEDPYRVWPQYTQESQEQVSLRLAHIMAWHLIQMSKDIEEYIRSGDVQNSDRTRKFRGELAAVLTCDMSMDKICHPRPQVESWTNGLNDRFDRCWAILSYVSWVPHMISWEKKLQYLAHPKNTAIGYDIQMPTVAIPRPNYGRLFEQYSASLPREATSAPVPILVKVEWFNGPTATLSFRDLPDSRRVAAGLAYDGQTLPSSDHVFARDPRTCNTIAVFRDSIRHALSCGTNELDVRAIDLLYRSETDDSDYKIEIDTYDTQWEVLRGIFSNLDNSNFVIRASLGAHDPQDGEVYETNERPPMFWVP